MYVPSAGEQLLGDAFNGAVMAFIIWGVARFKKRKERDPLKKLIVTLWRKFHAAVF